ncbi:DNA-directed RNA polymerase sigma-70 factor [Bryobacterales bacterium F-183]|nr:DNA-directed RNA polymerase sigma-70 factor [Bryobacterales bacterium F-183]
MAAAGQNDVASEPRDQSVTILLTRWRNGESEALTALAPIIYENLRQIAQRYMAGENPGHTLSATALVHEAYIRLLGADVPWQDRSHFLAIASREMRRVLVDHARSSKRQKRGGEWFRVSLDEVDHAQEENTLDVIAIEAALLRLEAIDPRKAQVIDLMIFGGLTAIEAAEVLKVSEVTVRREWRLAKAWLHHELLSSPSDSPSSDD